MNAYAKNIPVTKATDACYPTAEAAVARIATRLQHFSDRDEWAAAVLKDADCYRETVLVTNRDQDAVSFIVKKTKTQKTVAVIHSHPKGPHSHQFSVEDRKTADALGVPMYIYDMLSEKLFVYAQGASAAAGFSRWKQ